VHSRRTFSAVTRDACSLCAPLGAAIAYAGIRGGMTLFHGSQGCATYIRRYAISHFREPLDAASSGFGEEAAVFGGRDELRSAFGNLVRQYHPEFVGVATTCLAETIGEDAALVLRSLDDLAAPGRILLAAASTPSYRGDQRDGFRAATRAIVEAACPVPPRSSGEDRPAGTAAVFPAMLSPADLREIKRISAAFGLEAVLVSDYSETLDGGPWVVEDRLLPDGGTPVDLLRGLSKARYAIELGAPVADAYSGAAYLADSFGVERIALPLPIGVEATDRFLDVLSRISGAEAPYDLRAERGRLVDSYVDAHKVVFGAKALIYGDIDLRSALAAFCAEVGMRVVQAEDEWRGFAEIEAAAESEAAAGRPVDILIGSSKGYAIAKRLGVPLVRIGFPIHDRFGGQRIASLGYRGSQELFDRIVNALIEKRQEESDVGYTYF